MGNPANLIDDKYIFYVHLVQMYRIPTKSVIICR